MPPTLCWTWERKHKCDANLDQMRLLHIPCLGCFLCIGLQLVDEPTFIEPIRIYKIYISATSVCFAKFPCQIVKLSGIAHDIGLPSQIPTLELPYGGQFWGWAILSKSVIRIAHLNYACSFRCVCASWRVYNWFSQSRWIYIKVQLFLKCFHKTFNWSKS